MNDTPSNNSAKKYILVIEDDKFYGNIFKTKFTELGYDLTIAVNGDDGISEIKKRKPDLILLDLIMPMKDGFQTLQEIKSNSEMKDITVIVLSNLGQENDIQKAKNLGATDYFIKANISLQEAVDKVKQYLK